MTRSWNDSTGSGLGPGQPRRHTPGNANPGTSQGPRNPAEGWTPAVIGLASAGRVGNGRVVPAPGEQQRATGRVVAGTWASTWVSKRDASRYAATSA